MTTERDIRNQIAFAVAQGRNEGFLEGEARGRNEGIAFERLNTAVKLKSLGVPVETISEATGLSIAEIEVL